MVGRVTSARLIGRDPELGALRSVLDTAAGGSARIVLVSGEAGIGKTRLVSAALDEARSSGFVVAHGGCVDLGTVSVAFAPVAEALRRLQEQVANNPALEQRVDRLRARLNGEGGDGGPVFEQVLALLTEAGPVLLVLEDLHWADASTRDLVSFLARNLTGAVALVLTYRADEIVRGHPLRPVLANLERDADVDRVELTGLERDELEALLDEICESPPDADTVDLLHVRSGGNPFYVEELVAAGPAYTDALPGRIADVVLSRAAALPNESLDVLRAAAVIGDQVEDELIATVVGHPVNGPLREAVDRGLLVFDDTTCRFRHALVREALCREVLPGERTRLHLATAEALERTGPVAEHTRWARIAHHRDEAHDVERAFTASVRAAAEAERIYAFADAAEQYERALRLRPETEAPDVELLLAACDAMQAGPRARRALELAETALRELGTEASPEQRALVLERIGRINWKLHRGSAAVAAYEQGAALVADRPASRDKAYVLAALGQSLMLRQLYREAIDVLERAIEAGDVQGHALCSLGPCRVEMGQVDEAVAAMRTAIELSTAAGSTEDGSRAHANLMSCLYAGGRYAEAAAQAEESIEYVVRTGHARYYGDVVAGNAILSLYCAGRWDEAERLHDDPRIPNGEAYQELRWLPVLLDSGRLDEARTLLAAMLDATADADDVQFRALALLHAAELASIDGRPDEARELIADAQVLIARTDDQLYAAKLTRLPLPSRPSWPSARATGATRPGSPRLAPTQLPYAVQPVPSPRSFPPAARYCSPSRRPGWSWSRPSTPARPVRATRR